ncbi:glycoside hydrolase [Gloeophyllum trabeum ATCC 11539]|uniref:Glycoside hydrolase n=1 Tax=Gloeophyllum trabeum (strain ATCC 11539 / FP-39264 / Madison 617) TaxID=670483 RepID=S7RCM3_GLOTA|nr:glycoside hydrolase [Gloeophyllum trabeum ATCC 11539]EPQ50144.1 glycoside hydrolase [Gloeophyllum trabeum ATCC 11539]
MPSVPSTSPITGQPTPSHYVHTTDCQFVDNAGRTLLLRGVNLSGSAKAPVGKPSYVLEGFWETAENGGESFVGQPLNLEDGSADVHLARLRGWGFNMLRYVVTWEALEHEGPGKYDYEFMDYTVQVLRKCKEYGFKVFMDPHQDVWSRFSGGSGAPYWTLPACGINPRNFTATEAAIIHPEYPDANAPDPATLPAMIWSTNYGRLASRTIFTLFFAGNDFAPKCVIDGQNIQDYLQSHYVEALGQLADRIRDAGDLLDECVLGWDSMNEPFEGLLGWRNLSKPSDRQTNMLKKGTAPTPAQSFRLGMGEAQTVETWDFGSFGPKKTGSVTVDPRGAKMWADPSTEPGNVHPKWGWRRDPEWKLGECVWAQHGVWDVETGYIAQPDYFVRVPGEAEEVEPIEDYWKPHFHAFAKRIRQAHPEAILFVQPPVFAQPPSIDEEDLRGRCCYAPHYYDGLTLVSRHWNWFNADALGVLRGKYSSTWQAIKFGESAIRKSIQEQLGELKRDVDILGRYPTLIGEIGTPFDMDGKRSYGWTDDGKYLGDYSNQQKALDASLNAADGPNGLNYTIWTYCPDSCHEWGDGWNMEDLSLWSTDDMRGAGREELRMGEHLRESSGDKLLGSRTDTPTMPVTGATTPTFDVGSHPKGSPSGWRDHYDFLTDGARAVRAFCRPFPTAVVGVPQQMDFNIAKAEFKLTVRVRGEDAPRIPDSTLSLAGKESALPTEIYVPLVHFADDKLLGQSEGKETSLGDSPEPASEHGLASRNASTINLSPIVSPPTLASSTSTLLPQASSDLALSVSVSSGRYEVHGQTLKWWYVVPAEGEEEQEYTITIKRPGGPIKVKYDEAIQSAGAGMWSWLAGSLCPTPSGGCTIM